MDGGEGVVVGGLGVSVAVAGGVTRSSNFCSGRMTEVLFSPFQAIRSASGTVIQASDPRERFAATGLYGSSCRLPQG